jgi:tripartite-type tricarboxylate transporter receptor subunit TctC
MRTASISRRQFARLLAAGGTAFTGWRPAWAAFPDKQIRVIVPYAPGGPNDVVGRLVAQELGARWPQGAYVENRPGGGGTIGGAAVAKAAPDGHHLLIASSSFCAQPALFPALPYDLAKDLVPVVKLAEGPIVVTAHPSAPVSSIKELIDYAKAKPGELSYSSAGNATTPHLAAEYFNWKSGGRLTHIPFKGDGPATFAVLGGTVPIAFTALTAALPHIKSGKLKALGMTTRERVAALPQVPTIAEHIPGFELVGWFSVMAPGGTPASTIDALGQAVLDGLKKPQAIATLETSGLVITPQGPKEFKPYFDSELKKYTELIKAANITAQ